jgi:hypothetical protein
MSRHRITPSSVSQHKDQKYQVHHGGASEVARANPQCFIGPMRAMPKRMLAAMEIVATFYRCAGILHGVKG